MALDVTSAEELLSSYIDSNTGLVDRRIFTDPEIYRLEMEQIFARAWNFMAHETQIPNPGDYFQTSIGGDRVIVVRDREGQPQVLLNTCRHRGNAVCRAEEGHTSRFVCSYHGWTYDLQGNLIGLPGDQQVYKGELDRSQWGLIKAAKVESYRGFIFATMDAEAPSLYDYLGQTGRIAIELLAGRGTLKAVPGVQKFTIPCNWKLAVDNVFDWYHAQITHKSAFQVGFPGGSPRRDGGTSGQLGAQLVIFGEYGHAVSGPMLVDGRPPSLGADESWRQRPEPKAVLGPVGAKAEGHSNIFPNMWVNANQVSMRFPMGPSSTEIWWFTFLPEELPPPVRSMALRRISHLFGPAGMFEQDDGENWAQSTDGARGVISEKYPLNYAMGLNNPIEKGEGVPAHMAGGFNENGQMWYYRNWAEWMAAKSWDDLRAQPPEL